MPCMLIKKIGFKVRPNANLTRNINCLRAIGQKLLRSDRGEEAVAVFERWIEQQPGQAWAHDNLARAWQRLNQPQKAQASQLQAVEIANRGAHKYQAHFEKRLSTLQAAMKEQTEE